MNRPGITAIVVCLNDANQLDACLSSVAFCDELIVLDIGSLDNSIEVAAKYTENVFSVKSYPCVESVVFANVWRCKNEWLLLIDPDEMLEKELALAIQSIMTNENISIIEVPWQFYIANHKIKFTAWGGARFKSIVFRLSAVKIQPVVHKLVEKFSLQRKRIKTKHYLHHFWFSDWSLFIEKHERYAMLEGQILARSCKYSYSHIKHFLAICFAFAESFILKLGILGGPTEWALSFFYAWYAHRCHAHAKKFMLQS